MTNSPAKPTQRHRQTIGSAHFSYLLSRELYLVLIPLPDASRNFTFNFSHFQWQKIFTKQNTRPDKPFDCAQDRPAGFRIGQNDKVSRRAGDC
jgi:hypothetical protein